MGIVIKNSNGGSTELVDGGGAGDVQLDVRGIGGGDKGMATAWASIDVTASVPTIAAQYNIGSTAHVSGGTYSVTFTTPMDNTNYAIIVTQQEEEQIATAYASTYSKRTVNGFELYLYRNGAFTGQGVSIIVYGGKN